MSSGGTTELPEYVTKDGRQHAVFCPACRQCRPRYVRRDTMFVGANPPDPTLGIARNTSILDSNGLVRRHVVSVRTNLGDGRVATYEARDVDGRRTAVRIGGSTVIERECDGSGRPPLLIAVPRLPPSPTIQELSASQTYDETIQECRRLATPVTFFAFDDATHIHGVNGGSARYSWLIFSWNLLRVLMLEAVRAEIDREYEHAHYRDPRRCVFTATDFYESQQPYLDAWLTEHQPRVVTRMTFCREPDCVLDSLHPGECRRSLPSSSSSPVRSSQ